MKLSNPNIDIFCQVVDNFGDVGFSFRLAKFLKEHNPNRQIRLFVDAIETLQGILPEVILDRGSQTLYGVMIIQVDEQEITRLQHHQFSPLVIESLASPIPEFIRKQVFAQAELILTLEHLTAEPAFEAMHGLSVPTGNEVPRFMVAQGFTPRSGGILIEDGLAKKIQEVSHQQLKWRKKWLKPYQEYLPNDAEKCRIGSLFSYDRDMSGLIKDIQTFEDNFIFLVIGEMSQSAVKQALAQDKTIWLADNKVACVNNAYFIFQDMLPQPEYDQLLLCTDFNMVRGEDSLARAILAGKSFLWHSYDQGENYQLKKVNALLEVLHKYQDSSLVFANYVALMQAYNWRETDTEPDQPSENYCPFFKNLAIIQNWTNQLSRDLLAQGGLIPSMERLIESL